MTDDEKRKKINEMMNDPEYIKLSNIIGWAVQVEKYNLPLTLEEHLTLVNATMYFAKRIFPLYEKYQVKVDKINRFKEGMKNVERYISDDAENGC